AGASGATWHVARNWDGARDTRPISTILAGGSPAPPDEEDDMATLWLARIKGENAVWLCDGIHRRHLSAAELPLYRDLWRMPISEVERHIVSGMAPVGGPGK